jgi:hypothetical protein
MPDSAGPRPLKDKGVLPKQSSCAGKGPSPGGPDAGPEATTAPRRIGREILRAPGLWLGLGGLAVGLALAAGTRTYLLQVLGTAGALLGLAALAHFGGPWLRAPVRRTAAPGGGGLTRGGLLAELGAPLLLLGTLMALYHPLLAGQMPWQADHTVHQAKAWLLAERLLPSGRLSGWTHLAGTGYPAEELYPPLGDLWMTAVHYGSFGQLSWGATYALGFFGVLAFGVLAFYWMGRRLAGPLAGLVAGLFVLTDVGGFREGGYVFTIQYGVWPLHLGITLGFVALFKFHDLLTTPGRRHLRRTSLAVGAALLAHPVTLIFLLVALPLHGLYLWTRREPGDEPWLGRALAAVGIGLALAACWLLPFVTKASDYSAHVSNYWKTMPQIADGLLDANLWQGAWPWTLALGVVGGGWAWREGHRLATPLFALAGAMLLAGSLTLFSELRLAYWIEAARFVQFQRFVIFTKLCAFLLAGFAVQRLLRGVGPAVNERGEAPGDAALGRRAVARLGAALLVAPFVLPLGWRLVETKVLPVGKLTTAKHKQAFRRDFHAVLDRVCAEARRPDAPFFRVGFLSGFNDHEMANAQIRCPLRAVKLSFIPSETFKYRAHLQPAAVPRSREDFRALNLRYVITNQTRRAPAWLRKIEQRGRVTLYEVPGYRPDPFTVVRRVDPAKGPARFEPVEPGSVDVRLLRLSPERIRLRARDVPPDHYLVLHVAHFANWRAARGGEPLPIRAYDGLAPRVNGLMMVPLSAGETELVYRRLAVDHLGRALTLGALLLLALLTVAWRRPGLAAAPRARLAAWARRWRRPARWGAALLLLAGAGWLLGKAGGCLPRPARPRSLAHQLDRARVWLRTPGGKVRHCRTYQMGRWICGRGRRWVGPVSEEWNLLNRFGLWAHPDESGTLVVAFPDQRLGRALEVRYGILQSGGVGAPVTLTVFVGDQQVARIKWPRRRGPAGWAPRPLRVDTTRWRGQEATLRFEIRTSHIGGRHFVFDPRVVP